MAKRPIRLPLEVGVSSLWGLTGAAATLLPALAMTVMDVVFYLADDRTQSHYPEWVQWAALASLSAVLLLPYAFARAVAAVRERPSDVLLSPEGLRVEGGGFDGTFLEWKSIDPGASSIEVEHNKGRSLARIAVNLPSFLAYVVLGTCLGIPIWLLDSTITRGRLQAGTQRLFSRLLGPGQYDVWSLSVATGDGTRFVLATTERPVERDSFQALLDSIRSLAGGTTQQTRDDKPAPHDIEILHCPSCGAAATPHDSDGVACTYCGATVSVPDELRERIRALSVVAGRPGLAAMVERLLDQPGARAVSGRMLVGAVMMFLAWPVAFGVAAWLRAGHVLVLQNAMLLAAFAVAAILGVNLTLRAGLVDRQALRLVTLDLGARPPPRPGAPPGCHACGAPLVVVADQLVARCVYCGTDNVLGIDVRREARPLGRARISLQSAIGKRTRERWLWRSLAVGAVPLIVFAGWTLGRATQYAFDPLQLLRDQCDSGEMAHCQELGFHYDIGLGVPVDAQKAIELYRRACAGGYGLSCSSLAHKLAKGWGVPPDPSGAAHALEKGCELGEADQCEELGRAYEQGKGVPQDSNRALALFHKACASSFSSACREEKALAAQRSRRRPSQARGK
jgi:hypothetical protein